MMQFADQRSIYLQIADHICDTILAGELSNGERIASVREMAAQIEVNPNTVQRSYSFLQEKGILDNKRGIGYFIADDAYQQVKAIKREQFIQEDVQSLFKNMELLGIEFSDLQSIYQRHQQQI
ncbi:MAG: GntR family transcriptional regulator [Saprospiraceae bacterium]